MNFYEAFDECFTKNGAIVQQLMALIGHVSISSFNFSYTQTMAQFRYFLNDSIKNRH